jgi:hypothetical protein
LNKHHPRNQRSAGHSAFETRLFFDFVMAGADPTLFLQLAVSKEGIIAGTLQNAADDSVQSIEGMVDKKSQRTAWTVVDQSRPIMETGINNLTEDTAPALVHFADGQTQQWLLVRLEEPEEATRP